MERAIMKVEAVLDPSGDEKHGIYLTWPYVH